MHPALSIILFTTLSGLGFGFFVWLGLGRVPADAQQASAIVAFVLSSAGLSASAFHLGHPERAWRAFSQWRSSWLSREGVMAVITLGLAFAWWYMGYARWLGALLAVSALLTVYATSMIYAQMRSVRQWNTPLTPVVFIFMSLAGGGLMCVLGDAFTNGASDRDLIAVAIVMIAAWSAKARWWRRADGSIEISDSASATGLADSGQVRMFESPHSGSSYLLDEMGFRVGRKHAQKLRIIALVAGGAVPILLLSIGVQNANVAAFLLVASILFHLVGVLAERWLFFAEARHAVMSFYD